jgi:hypothetical protein
MKESYEVPSVRFSHGSGSVSENEMPHGWRTSLRQVRKFHGTRETSEQGRREKLKGGRI